jgi:hypothetical protein
MTLAESYTKECLEQITLGTTPAGSSLRLNIQQVIQAAIDAERLRCEAIVEAFAPSVSHREICRRIKVGFEPGLL